MAGAQPNTPALAQELASIAARAQTYTGASGAAIALSEGDVNEMICRACSGPSAPDVGVTIRLEGTFSGMAVQSGQALRCDDSETDSRVDAAACRALGTRSIVVVPIRDLDTEQVIGVLAVFAGNKNSFNDLHVAVLRTMAREVAVAVQKSRKAGISIDEATGVISAYRPPSSPGFAPPSLTPPVSAATPRPGPVPVPSPAAAAAKPALEIAPTVMSPAPKLAPPTPPPPPKAVPHEPLPMAAPVAPAKKTFTSPATPEWKPAPPPPPRRLEPIVEKVAEKKETRPVAASFGTFDSVADDKKVGGGGVSIWIGVGIAAVVIVGGYFTYNALSSKPGNQPAPQQQAQTSAATPDTAASQPPAAVSPQSTSTSAPAQTTAQPQPAAVKPAPQPQAPPPSSAPAPHPQQQAAQPERAAVERAAVTPIAGGRTEAPPQPVTTAGLPQIQVPITTAAPTLVAPKVSQSTPAQMISQVMPKYPDMARTMKASGNVQLEATVGKDGSVKAVKVVSGHTLLRDAAAQAVRQWKYRPATLNGEPVESTVQVTVKFPEIR